MRNAGRAIVVFVALALAGVAAKAQFRMRPPSFSGIWNPVVGSGATYEVIRGDNSTMTMEVAVVGKETVNGKDAFWMETSFTPPNGRGEMVSKTLMVHDGNDLVPQKMIMQMGDRPPMEMPEEMVQRMAQRRTEVADISKTADDLGSDSVTTPAGTFACEHYKLKDGSGDFWVKAGTGPYGLVKSVQMDGTTMVLSKLITDAKDKVNGTPQPFTPMGRGGRGPGN